jgi:hypothetical protein
LITWVSFSKIKEAAQVLGATFYHGKICVSTNFDKKWVSYILGDFFTNSSGHSVKAWTAV